MGKLPPGNWYLALAIAKVMYEYIVLVIETAGKC